MIIESMLDNDLYKFTMQQAVLHQFSDAIVEYKFKCRTEDINFLKEFSKITSEIRNLSFLEFEDEDLDYLSSLRFMKRDYVDFLRTYKFNIDYVKSHLLHSPEKDEFELRIKGPWLQTILFEVPILAIISEVYTTSQLDFDIRIAERNLKRKVKLLRGLPIKFVDFGTRRRSCRSWQNYITDALHRLLPNNFVGTSNVYFAKKHNITPIGTMAHEWIQAHQALGYRLIDSQKMAFENWAKEYRGDLGIALSDTLGVDVFLKDFDLFLAKLFDGVRQDSGDPEEFIYKITNHYKKLGIDLKTKTIVFSDGLDFNKMVRLYMLSTQQGINSSFGIGTNLTNDCGTRPIQIVIKMVSCNGTAVAKVSDSPGKGMCEDKNYEDYLKRVLGIKRIH